MKKYFDDRVDAALYVFDIIRSSKQGWQLTMTITRGKSGGLSVDTATYVSSEDTDLQTAKFFSQTQVNT